MNPLINNFGIPIEYHDDPPDEDDEQPSFEDYYAEYLEE